MSCESNVTTLHVLSMKIVQGETSPREMSQIYFIVIQVIKMSFISLILLHGQNWLMLIIM
jgi:hypothetical protein